MLELWTIKSDINVPDHEPLNHELFEDQIGLLLKPLYIQYQKLEVLMC